MSKLGDIFNKHTERKDFSKSEVHWAGLESMLDAHDAKRKRGGAIWWLSGMVLAVILCVSGWLISDTPSSNNLATLEVVGASENQEKETVINEEVSDLINTNSSNNQVDNAENNLSNQATYNLNNISSDNDHLSVADNELPTEDVTPLSNAREEEAVNFSNLPISIVLANKVEEENPEMVASSMNNELTQVNEINLESNHADLNLMDLLGNSMIENEINLMPPTEKDFLKKENNLRFEIGLYGGGMYVGKSLRSSTAFDYVDKRNEEESGRLSFNSGLDLNMKLGKFIISTGLNYHQQGETTNYSNEYEDWVTSTVKSYEISENSYWQVNTTSFSIITDENYTTQIDTAFTFWDDASGMYVTDTVSVQAYVINNIGTQQFNLIDSTYVQQIDSVEHITLDSSLQTITDANTQQKTTTKFSYVEIPILVGYEFPINRMVISVKTGVGVGLLTQHNATYWISDIGAPQLLSRSDINTVMLNYLLKLGLGCHITENWSIKAESFYRLNLTNALNSTDITQKYWNAGLNIGVVYGF